MSEKKAKVEKPPAIDVLGWSKDKLTREYLKRQRQSSELGERKNKLDRELRVISDALNREMVNDQEQEIQWTAANQSEIECYGQPGKIIRTSRKDFINLGTKINLQCQLSKYFQIEYKEKQDDAELRATKCVTWLFANRTFRDKFFLKRYTIEELEKASSKKRKTVPMNEQ